MSFNELITIEAEDWTAKKHKLGYAVTIDDEYFEDLDFETLIELIRKKLWGKFQPKSI